MNVIDVLHNILYNYEQLNWDALSTITNIILVLALVLVTCFYAMQVKRQTKLMEKDRKKQKILEGIQNVLNVFIECINSEIDAIKKGKSYSYSTEQYFGQKFNLYFNDKALYSDTFWDIMGESVLSKPFLKYELRSNDKLSNKLNGLYTKIKEELTTEFENEPKFEERLKDWRDKFNQLHHKLQFETRELPDLEALCKDYIISKWDLNDIFLTGSERNSMFLKEYKSELLKYRDLPRVKELLKEIEDTLNKFKKSDEQILKQFKKIKEKYRKEYHFCEVEINIGVMNLRALQKTLGH
ncbi:MAG TPA: hypothetical protein VMW40_06175 [Candidatus Bathyarchaeia archaeon]|nr:hypothetical protein [Candidatus Bathyarchaeia archaeon]